MKLGVYDVINDPLPKLFKINEINVEVKDFKSDQGMVDVLNDNLKMDKLTSEHCYAIALNTSLYPKGIIQCTIGDCVSASLDQRKLAIALLLLGAERFYYFHNHPGYCKEISTGDRNVTEALINLSNTINISFDKHIMITKDFFDYCDVEDNLSIPFN